MSYDVKCDELARAFLNDDEAPFTEAEVAELAQLIQDAIETYLSYGRKNAT